jgi:hypothetical protein
MLGQPVHRHQKRCTVAFRNDRPYRDRNSKSRLCPDRRPTGSLGHASAAVEGRIAVLRAIDQNGNWHRGTVMAGHATESEENPSCSWCHLPKDRVAFLVASPTDHPRVYICDECIEVCHSVLEKRRMSLKRLYGRRPARARFLPKTGRSYSPASR